MARQQLVRGLANNSTCPRGRHATMPSNTVPSASSARTRSPTRFGSAAGMRGSSARCPPCRRIRSPPGSLLPPRLAGRQGARPAQIGHRRAGDEGRVQIHTRRERGPTSARRGRDRQGPRKLAISPGRPWTSACRVVWVGCGDTLRIRRLAVSRRSRQPWSFASWRRLPGRGGGPVGFKQLSDRGMGVALDQRADRLGRGLQGHLLALGALCLLVMRQAGRDYAKVCSAAIKATEPSAWLKVISSAFGERSGATTCLAPGPCRPWVKAPAAASSPPWRRCPEQSECHAVRILEQAIVLARPV